MSTMEQWPLRLFVFVNGVKTNYYMYLDPRLLHLMGVIELSAVEGTTVYRLDMVPVAAQDDAWLGSVSLRLPLGYSLLEQVDQLLWGERAYEHNYAYIAYI